jgi:hypothetical protein
MLKMLSINDSIVQYERKGSNDVNNLFVQRIVPTLTNLQIIEIAWLCASTKKQGGKESLTVYSRYKIVSEGRGIEYTDSPRGNYDTSNGSFGANINDGAFLTGAGIEKSGLAKMVGGSLGFNSQTGFSASVNVSLNGQDANKNPNRSTGLSLSVDRTGANLGLQAGGANLANSHSVHGFSMNENFTADGIKNGIMSAAQKEFDAEIEKSTTSKSVGYLKDKKNLIQPPLSDSEIADLAKPENRERREALLKQVRAVDPDNKAKGTSRPKDDVKGNALGELADGFRNLGNQLGIGSINTHSASGFVDAEGKFHPRTCFVKGTLVHTATGLKPIEEIVVGEMVLSWDEKTGKNEYKKVLNTFVRNTDQLYNLTIGKEKISTTWNHPFYVKDKGWVQAKDLQRGEILISAKGTMLSLSDITIEERDEVVYNFEVEGNHTYYVGDRGVLVHNECFDKDEPKTPLATKHLTAGLKLTRVEIEEQTDIRNKKTVLDSALEEYNTALASSKTVPKDADINVRRAKSIKDNAQTNYDIKVTEIARLQGYKLKGEDQGYRAEIEARANDGDVTSRNALAQYDRNQGTVTSFNRAQNELDKKTTKATVETFEHQMKTKYAAYPAGMTAMESSTLNSFKVAHQNFIQEETNYKNARNFVLDKDKEHSKIIQKEWQKRGMEQNIPLTPFAKQQLKKLFPRNPDIDKILQETRLMRIGDIPEGENAKGHISFFSDDSILHLKTSISTISADYPGNFDQGDSGELGTLAHEITHLVQRKQDGFWGFNLRYIWEKVKTFGDNYGVKPFLNEGASINDVRETTKPFPLNREVIVGKENMKEFNGQSVSYDNIADVNREIMRARIKLDPRID